MRENGCKEREWMDEEKDAGNGRSNGMAYRETEGESIQEAVQAEELPWEKQMSVMRAMFPFVSAKAALQEKHFTKGYACSCRIFAMENREEWASMKQYLEAALEEYQRSYEEAGTVESVANLLWALCVGYASSVDGETAENAREEYTGSCYETGMLLMGILRESKEYAALAEYYFALQYFIGMVGNKGGVEFNRTVGVELMKALVILGNPYAVSFVEECELIG